MFSKSAKNVYDMVIGPVEFRKTGYFATWWRLVAMITLELFKAGLFQSSQEFNLLIKYHTDF